MTCVANSSSVLCGWWREPPGLWGREQLEYHPCNGDTGGVSRDTGSVSEILGAVSWAVQLLSRTATELVVEREGREETREHNIDADDLRLPRRHGPLAAPCPTALRRVSYVPCLAHVYCAVVSSSVR